MTNFKERDLLKVTADGAARWNGGCRLTKGMIVRVTDISPQGNLIKIHSSLLDADHLSAWWDVNRFKLHEAALPIPPETKPNHRERAEQMLAAAEEQYNTGASLMDAGSVVNLGILHALLVEPEPQVQPRRSLVEDRIGELRQEKDRLQGQLDDSWSERETLRHRVDELESELNSANEARTELRRQLDTEQIQLRLNRQNLRAAEEEINRLNRERGIVPTREEAVGDQTARVLDDVRAERVRQVADGWTPEHDDDHDTHTLVRLAEQYAHKPESDRFEHNGYYSRRRLVQATALLVAAIEAWDRRDAEEEISRLNREQGIVPTRDEAVADVKGFEVAEGGNTVVISDGDDVIRFERPIDFHSDSFIFAADIPEDGVYITRSQWDALTRKGEAWAKDREDG